MDSLPKSSIELSSARWWDIPSWEEILPIAVKYRAILFGLVVASLFLYAEEQLRVMDHRFFQPSYDGVYALTRYQLGHYTKAAQAYRTDLRKGGWREWTNGNEDIPHYSKGTSPKRHDWLTYNSRNNRKISKRGWCKAKSLLKKGTLNRPPVRSTMPYH